MKWQPSTVRKQENSFEAMVRGYLEVWEIGKRDQMANEHW
jgi:hypothetical protein